MLIVDVCQLNAQFHLTCTLISYTYLPFHDLNFISFNFNLINAIFYLLAANNIQVTSTFYLNVLPPKNFLHRISLEIIYFHGNTLLIPSCVGYLFRYEWNIW